jgi:hypothetical protein
MKIKAISKLNCEIDQIAFITEPPVGEPYGKVLTELMANHIYFSRHLLVFEKGLMILRTVNPGEPINFTVKSAESFQKLLVDADNEVKRRAEAKRKQADEKRTMKQKVLRNALDTFRVGVE